MSLIAYCESESCSGSKALRATQAFSLVEILLVVAVIAILSGLAMTYVGGAADNSSQLVAHQQQIQLQTALDAWISAQSSGGAGLAGAKTAYNTDASVMMSALQPYLRDTGIFTTSGGSVRSAALTKIGRTLYFSSWAEGGYPKVLMQ